MDPWTNVDATVATKITKITKLILNIHIIYLKLLSSFDPHAAGSYSIHPIHEFISSKQRLNWNPKISTQILKLSKKHKNPGCPTISAVWRTSTIGRNQRRWWWSYEFSIEDPGDDKSWSQVEKWCFIHHFNVIIISKYQTWNFSWNHDIQLRHLSTKWLFQVPRT